MKKKHASFTLLEVIVSLVLVGILLTFVFTFFKQTLITKNQTFLLKEKTLGLELFYIRLSNLCDHFSEKEKYSLTNLTHADAIGSALFIQCDNGIYPDPSLSGPLYSMLFKTRDHRLCLCTWSKNNIAQVDTLLSQIKDFSFEFFSEKQWYKTWPKDKINSSLPLMIKISILLQGENEKQQDFIFSLPSCSEIFYEKKAI